jgi:hypothetical protein
MHTKSWCESLLGGQLSKDFGVVGMIILEWILEKWGGKLWT